MTTNKQKLVNYFECKYYSKRCEYGGKNHKGEMPPPQSVTI